MTRKPTILLLLITTFCFVTIVVLYALSDKHIQYSQNFTRNFAHGDIQLADAIDLKSDFYYIAGITSERIYLGNKKHTLTLLALDTSLSGIQQISITIEGSEPASFKEPYVQIDSPFFYVKDGNAPALFRGNVNEWHAYRHLDHSPPFTQAVPIASNSFVIQTIIGSSEHTDIKNIFGKVIPDSPYVKLNTELPEARTEGYNSTDGILRFNKELNQLVYTYFYCNQYLVMDTSLNLLYKSQTIDTVTLPKMKMAKVSENTYTLASPPALVNRNSVTSGKWMYVHSNLMGENESRKSFDTSSAIDVYDLTMQRYAYSFYIPDYRNEHVEGFRVSGNYLYAVYKSHFAKYRL